MLPRAPVRWAFVAVLAWLAAYEARLLALPGLDLAVLTHRFAHVAVLLAGAVLCLAGARTHRRERAGWTLIGLGILGWALGELHYTVALWEDPAPPVPSPADLGYLLFPVLGMAGGLGLLRAGARALPRTAWVDGLTVGLAVAALSAAIVVGAVDDDLDGRPLAAAVGLAYPVADLLLIALCTGALAARGWRVDRRWVLLAAGVGSFWLADSLYLVATAAGAYNAGGWFDAFWWTGLVLIALASWQRPPAEERRDDGVRIIAVPLGFAAVALAVLVTGCLTPVPPAGVALAGASLAAVMLRLLLTFRENVAMLRASRREAHTDPLTGLGNRRALDAELARRLEGACAERPVGLALFDLDGFKAFNDAFGHPAGDALLARVGASLAAHFAGRGPAFRLGGDEFCALVELGSEPFERMLARAVQSLLEHGQGGVGCSHGSVRLPEEASDAAAAVALADQRLYAAKQARGRRPALLGAAAGLAADAPPGAATILEITLPAALAPPARV